MSTANTTVSSAYARSLLDYLRALGLKPEAVLPSSEVTAIEAGDMHGQTDQSAWFRMMEQVADHVDEPNIGLKIGESMQIRHLGMAGYVMMSCSMLGEAAEQLGRFLRLLGTLGTGKHRMQRHGDLVELTFGWEGDGTPPPTMQQIFAASCAQISRWLTGRPDLEWGAHFCFPQPPDLSEYQRIFRGALRFGQARAKLIFPLAYLRLPINMGNPELRQMVEDQAEAVLETLQDEPEILRKSKVAITRNLGTGHATLTNVAKALNMSPRTLHRRLEAVGCTFRDLVDGVRQARAETFLRNKEVSLAEIAFMLGYSEQSTFHNAFKRWTGKTPNEFRAAAA